MTKLQARRRPRGEVRTAAPRVRLSQVPWKHVDSSGEGGDWPSRTQLLSGRFLASGDESGTAPEDRPFRPDVEGLRAVAVLLVVLFHSGVSALSGGYVGVDVFFVISGFVITGVLLRERSTTGRTSILAFYGRRCRRIIPAATLVIIVTVLLSYFFLGVGAGGRTATDGRWATRLSGQLPFQRGRDELPERAAAALAAPELLVACPSRSSSTSSTRRCSCSWRAFGCACRSGCASPLA